MNILVSLINYNSRDFILSCLEDIYKQKTTHTFKVVVFDNDSPDKSADEIKKKFPKIELIKHEKNIGFGKAHTLVADKYIADYDVLLLVNPDISFNEDTFEKMFSRMESDKNIGILSGKIYKVDKSLDSNGGNYPFGLALLVWLFNLEMFGINYNFHRTDAKYYETFHSVDWVGGTFVLIRKELIKKVGLFDADYFMYFEDVELGYRAKKAGFLSYIDPEFSVIHHSGGSSDNPRYFQWSNEYKNLLMFYGKNFGGLGSLFVRILVYISIVLRIFAFGILGKLKIAKTYMKVLVSI